MLEDHHIRYGDTLRIRHLTTRAHLHSHNIKWDHPGSSRQQQVTGFDTKDDNDWWIVKGPHDAPVPYGHKVHAGAIIRLTHVATGCNLHSHAGHLSPITKQQEVTCFGTNGTGDSNDNWKLELTSGKDDWHKDEPKFRLIHCNTNHSLHSHDIPQRVAHSAQREVTAFDKRDDNDFWVVEDRKPNTSPIHGTVHYGDVVRIQHKLTGAHLHSHAINYNHARTSGQQQVTGFASKDDNDWWIVKGPHEGPPVPLGAPVAAGAVIRLEHVATKRNLHSHGSHPSPVTHQQEVTCYGNNGQGDANDNWKLECTGVWNLGEPVRLVHVLTNHTLHSHNVTGRVPISNQQEVTAFDKRDDNDLWCVVEFH
eukprot:TRINITY_DN1436_c0_g1_i3.p1 TRINITY_DN1436_c0_g1~~TRINITY_DN1436_c0_g1_i3.p1  ORF type:complete len:365 (-),score=109.47 TRINITY_DN1436_c0_g1_i3:109-1203(-)